MQFIFALLKKIQELYVFIDSFNWKRKTIIDPISWSSCAHITASAGNPDQKKNISSENTQATVHCLALC